MSELHDAKRIRAELEAIARLIESLPVGQLKAWGDMLGEHDGRLDDLAACLIDGTQPELTTGVQARLVIHKQEKT